MSSAANPMANQKTVFMFACSIQIPCVKFDLHFQFGVPTVETAILVDVDVNVSGGGVFSLPSRKHVQKTAASNPMWLCSTRLQATSCRKVW
jgi:hypothetical protein